MTRLVEVSIDPENCAPDGLCTIGHKADAALCRRRYRQVRLRGQAGLGLSDEIGAVPTADGHPAVTGAIMGNRPHDAGTTRE